MTNKCNFPLRSSAFGGFPLPLPLSSPPLFLSLFLAVEFWYII